MRANLEGLQLVMHMSYANDCYGTDLNYVNWEPRIEANHYLAKWLGTDDSPAHFVYGFCIPETEHWSAEFNADLRRSYTTHPGVVARLPAHLQPPSSLLAIGDPCPRMAQRAAYQVDCMAFRAFAARNRDLDGDLEVWSLDAPEQSRPDTWTWRLDETD